MALDEPVRVETYAGGRGDELPRAFFRGGERVEVAAVRRSWIEEEMGSRERRRFFEVAGADGSACTIYHDERLGAWFLRLDNKRPCRI